MESIYTVFFFIILTTTTLANPISEEKSGTDLYSPEDEVEVLTADNFYEKIDNSSSAWFVKFYLNWCGHCQRLSHVWKDLARDIYPWKDMIQVGAIDCAEEDNIEVCREQGVNRYPILKYYPLDVEVVVPESEETVKSIRHYLIDQIMADIQELGDGIYPNLLPYQHSGLEMLFDEEPVNTKYVFLIIQELGDYVGVEVALDFHKTPNVIIRYALSNATNLPEYLDIDRYPYLLAINNQYDIELMTASYSTRDQLKHYIVEFLKSKNREVIVEEAPRKIIESTDVSNTEEKLKNHVKMMGDVVFQKDLESALRYSLKQEVATLELIDDEKLAALVGYLQVLTKYFPFSYKASPFLAQLMNLTSSEVVEGEKIAEIVDKWEDRGIFSSEQGFLGCLGSSFRFRGYPCSLWKLFHYLTVNADDETNPGEVLKVMLAYVKNFFSCKECSEHFQEMALRRNLTKVSSLDGAILWLWEAHNEVNERLKGDVTEDPEFPKEQFPGRDACPKCFQVEDSSWNEEEVLVYLKNMYGRMNVRYLGSNTLVLFEGLH